MKKNLYDVIIVGAGIVGLATAYQIINYYKKIRLAIIEKENEVAKHQSGRNSGVIHSGIYYKPNSLKAKNCVNGYKLLINFCLENNVPFKICGKLIIASNEKELETLNLLYERGIANGLSKIKLIDSNEINAIEPHVKGIKALYVPYTGVIDYRLVCLKLKELLLQKNVDFYFSEEVIKIKENLEHVKVITKKGNIYETSILITCAGLFSDKLAKQSFNKLDFRIIPFKGKYYILDEKGQSLINSLVYQVPDLNFPFLGIHISKHIGNIVTIGPNAFLVLKREGYKKFSFSFTDVFNILTWKGFYKMAYKHLKLGIKELYLGTNKNGFIKEAKKILPLLEKENLLPYNNPGIRAQICTRNGTLFDDFLILNTNRVLHVCNAPSPAATASFSIGNHILDNLLNLKS